MSEEALQSDDRNHPRTSFRMSNGIEVQDITEAREAGRKARRNRNGSRRVHDTGLYARGNARICESGKPG